MCDADLEDELVRALGIPRVLEVVAAAGDLDAWHILLNQPFHRARPQAAVLRRFSARPAAGRTSTPPS